jgi:hypothetical protein
VLNAIAKKRISMRDPAVGHVGKCSPCFAKLTEMRSAIHRQRVLRTAGIAAAAVILLTVFLGYFAFQKGSSPVPSPQSQRIATVLDLRSASATRTVQPPGSNQSPIEIPRGLLIMTINLPIGSEAATYEVQIRKPGQPSGISSNGQARIENGITELMVEIDTTSLPRGIYDFAWREAKFDWTFYPILIR